MGEKMREIIFILTTRCNQKCSFCCEPHSQDDFSLEYAKYCIDIVSKNSIEWIDLSGGEPLLHKNIVDIAEYSYKKKIKTTLSTNGIILENFYSDLKYNIHQWNLSLHGLKETHNKITNNKYSYDKIIKTCEFLVSENKIVHITYVVTKQNVMEINEVMKILTSIGVQKICFNYVFRRGNGQQYITDSEYSFEDLYKLTKEYGEKAKDIIVYHNYNYDGQCLLLRSNGSIWAVPLSNKYDYKEISTIDCLNNLVKNYIFIDNHLKFQENRLKEIIP
jgi:MoaA/NifB/PqqE/SkfB family radical SAM enzyme